jgi:predicted ATPase
MKITVKNLGAVEQAEIDLKPLTVFVGHNGTGKTWTAYALASIFSRHGYGEYFEKYLESKTQQSYPILDETIEMFLQKGSAEIDIVQFAKDNLQSYINDIASLAPTWMRSYLLTKRVNFEDFVVEINLHNSEINLIEEIKNSSSYASLSIASKELNLFKEAGSNQIFFFIESKKKSNTQIPLRIIKTFIYGGVFEILHRAFFSEIRLFPTERTTLITLPVHNKEKASRFSNPSLSFIDMVSETPFISLDNREEEAEKNPKIKHYGNLANFLEDNILQGKAYYEDNGIYKELLFSTKNVNLEISVTSSMIKELVSLVLYLRYLAKPDDLIIIDEPEMHLHPAAQIEIIEFLAMLVNAGLNVMITTHSPYIVGHISNLIEAKKQHNPEEIKDYFYLEDSSAFIEQDKVSVYLFEDNTAKNILKEDGSINWETFWNVSSDVSGIYAQLLKNKKS